MPGPSPKQQAYAYAERIRERMPRRVQELREARGLGVSVEGIFGDGRRGGERPEYRNTAGAGLCFHCSHSTR